ININCKDINLDTPLHFACDLNFTSIAEALMNSPKKADVNAIDKQKNVPLFLACKNNNEKIVKQLIEKGANIQYWDPHFKGKAVHFVFAKNNLELYNLILSHEKNSNLVRFFQTQIDFAQHFAVLGTYQIGKEKLDTDGNTPEHLYPILQRTLNNFIKK